jgi:hypothetical protein
MTTYTSNAKRRVDAIIRSEIAKCRQNLYVSELHLEYLGLKQIPPEVKGLAFVRKIFLTGNEIESVREEDLPSNCTFLCLRNNKIKKVDDLTLPHFLQTLDLSYNELENFDGSKFSQLRNLTLSHNNINVLKFPPRVITVNANFNNIEELSDFPLSLQSVELLDNKITQLPEMNEDLEFINVSQNLIYEFPEFPNNLKTICISHNEIKEIDKPLPSSLQTFKSMLSKDAGSGTLISSI